jgi:hypothetical protein
LASGSKKKKKATRLGNMLDPDRLVQTNSEQADDEYEEALVYVRFDDFDDVEFFKKSSEIRVENVGYMNPTCYIDGFRFGGRHEVNLGTVLFFEKAREDPETSCASSGANISAQRESIEPVKCVAMTDRSLRFSLQEIPIVPRSEIEGNMDTVNAPDDQQQSGRMVVDIASDAEMQS